MATPFDDDLTDDERTYLQGARDMVADGPGGSKDPWQFATDYVRLESYRRLSRIRGKLAEPQPYKYELWKYLIHCAVDELRLGSLRRFAPFAALFYELAGKDVVPYLRSIYLAAICHPDVILDDLDEEDARDLITFREIDKRSY